MNWLRWVIWVSGALAVLSLIGLVWSAINLTGDTRTIVTWIFWISFIVLVIALYLRYRNEPGADAVEVEGPPFARFLFSNRYAGWVWLPIRVFLGFAWLDAGLHKLTGTGWMDGGARAARILEERGCDPGCRARVVTPPSPMTGIATSSTCSISEQCAGLVCPARHPRRDRRRAGADLRSSDRARGVLRSVDERVVPARRLDVVEPGAVHVRDRRHARVARRGLLRARPLSAADARHAVAGRLALPQVGRID